MIMNTSKEEFLSALLDDEAGKFEQHRLLDELSKNAELGQTLSRYALIGEAMRASKPVVVARRDFLSNIHAGLDEEPTYSETVVEFAKPASQTLRSTKPPAYAYYGVAATLAAVALIGGALILSPSQPVEQLAANAPIQPAALVQLAQAVPTRSANQLDPQSRNVLRQYVAQHVKYASTTAIVPTVRAVSYSNDY